MKIKATKAWHKMPTAHAQWFDKEADGSLGECASWHGYDRSVKMTFAGNVDEMGWIFPFGELRKVKAFLEYYFDHTAVIPANDPRKDAILEFNKTMQPQMFQARVLPYGVSMEMSSLFIFEQVNPYIYQTTGGRCYIEKVECIEHDSNAAYLEVDETTAKKQAQLAIPSGEFMVMKPEWDWVEPQQALSKYK